MEEEKSVNKTLEVLRWTYKVFRSIIFTLVIVIVALFALLYVGVALPPVQNLIRERAEAELESFLGSKVEIGNLSILPLNEVILEDAQIYDLNHKKCLSIGKLGAGINIWKLIFKREVEITYVELLNFRGDIYQLKKGAPLNIDFIIKAFEPKDKNKPPTKFDLKIHNIVLRNGKVGFSRLWQQRGNTSRIDFNYLQVENLSADITIPRLSNEDTQIDLRRLSFNEKSGLQVREIGGMFKIQPDRISAGNLVVRLPETVLNLGDVTLPLSLFKKGNVKEETIHIDITDSRITPSNLSAFVPALASFSEALPIEAAITGNLNQISVAHLNVGSSDNLLLSLSGMLDNIADRENLIVDAENISLKASKDILIKGAALFTKASDHKLENLFSTIGDIDLGFRGSYRAKENNIKAEGALTSAVGELSLSADGRILPNAFDGTVEMAVPTLNLDGLLAAQDIFEKVENARLDIDGHFDFKEIKSSSGNVEFTIGEIGIFGRHISNINGKGSKRGNLCTAELNIEDLNLDLNLDASVDFNGEKTNWDLLARLNDFDTYNSFISEDRESGFEVKGEITAHATGNSIDNLLGSLELSDFSLKRWDGSQIDVDRLSLTIGETAEGEKQISLNSNIIDFNLEGNLILSRIPGMVKTTLHEVSPLLFAQYQGDSNCGSGVFSIDIKDASQLIEFFKIPVIPLTELTFSGKIDSSTRLLELNTEIPYIQQGKNLVTDTYLDARLSGEDKTVILTAGTIYPTKKGLLKMDLDVKGTGGEYDVALALNRGRNVRFNGDVFLKMLLDKDPEGNAYALRLDWLPSALTLNDALWSIEESSMIFDGRQLRVNDFCVRHADQFVFISGYNDIGGEGDLNVTLADINLDYLFDTLNIPHVDFGGRATGGAVARNIFSSDPDIHTENLRVENLSYNGCVIGDGDISGRLDMPAKMVAINAEINEGKKRVADVDGGVWFGRDSLAFDFKADSVNIGFMQPFMQAFSSDVKGKASGDVTLYGTFSDIDMVGSLVAHDADILIDYINVRYQASDSVYLYPGRIELPDFKVRDKMGHTAIVNGVLTHRYFHEPAFRFRISDMDNLLVYDTNSKINPLWYGKIFASGAGEITGKPGTVNIAADVMTDPGSDFTFVLSDQQEAVKSHFLTFSDRRKEAATPAATADTVPEFLQRFRRNNQQIAAEEHPDIFTMDFRVSVTPDIVFNLVMDPVAGDKIRAYGEGAMTLTYTSLTDEMKLYGKYVLEKGDYNFSLQDIILKDFIIKPGSSIAFTGNPYTGILDITAAYRVNTSLTELDRSFASDRELNRTSVPVEALLKVSGVLTSPNIDFDIELPTVTEETARKVKSIISTDDMMNRQVLYLVALNKFYPPEYMSTSNSGGEWASIASSTVSSQIQNMIGQITDKFTLAPSIRSDKGDFSDIEVDLALSSQLFNNRLLLNGNLGYRDPSNSSTTFVGDFDLEYLLNKKGTWRLKAYNHFNDQNYYLKSALTTQGLGIIWRREFGAPTVLKQPAVNRKEKTEVQIEEMEIAQ